MARLARTRLRGSAASEPVLLVSHHAVGAVVKAAFAAIRAVTEKPVSSEADVLAAYSKLAVFLDEVVQEARYEHRVPLPASQMARPRGP